jgi:membrane protein EpsK
VGLWQVPFLLAHFKAAYGNDPGIAAYGQIGVRRCITDYAVLIAFAFTSTISRFMAIRLNKDDSNGAQTYFTSAFVAIFGLCGLATILALLCRPFIANWAHAPLSLANDFGLLFVLMMLSSSATALNSPFMSVPFARHRFDLINLLKIVGFGIQVAILVFLFSRHPASLVFVGTAYLLKELWSLGGATVLARKMAPWLTLSLRPFRREAVAEMARMSFWSAINRLGFLLYFSIDLIVINILLGNTACGRYAPMTQLALLLSLFAAAVANVFWPIAYEHIARNRMDQLIPHIQRTTKYMGLTLGLPVALLCGLGRPVLTVWLHDPEWAAFAPLLVILLAPAVWNFSLKHVFSITHGLNRVRVPALITLAGGLLNLGLSIFLVKYTSLGLYGIAVATSLALTLRNLVAMPLYAEKVIHKPAGTFLRGIPAPLAAAACTAVIGYLSAQHVNLATLPRLVAAGAALTAIHLGLSLLVLNREDLRFLTSLFKRRESS